MMAIFVWIMVLVTVESGGSRQEGTRGVSEGRSVATSKSKCWEVQLDKTNLCSGILSVMLAVEG